MDTETLQEAQTALQDKSQVARKRKASRNGSDSKKKKGLRVRTSVKSLLVLLAQANVHGNVRAWAIHQLLLLGGKPVSPLPFEVEHEEQESSSASPTSREPVDWSAKPV
jgi:hypothetical protein